MAPVRKCGFCQGQHFNLVSDFRRTRFYVKCSDCGRKGPSRKLPQDAWTGWHRAVVKFVA